jgi:hypothetical protein
MPFESASVGDRRAGRATPPARFNRGANGVSQAPILSDPANKRALCQLTMERYAFPVTKIRN